MRDTERWLDTAVSGIRFGPDRKAVRQELAEHMEDKMAGLGRSFPDLPEEEARDLALASMGDPEEVKIQLAKIHRPWLGYLWRASQALLVLALLLALVWGHGIVRVFSDGVSDLAEQREVYGERFPDSLSEPPPAWGQVLALGEGEGPAEAGGYTFTVERASLLRVAGAGGDPFYLAFTLRGAGTVHWALPGAELASWIQVTDSRGRLYRSTGAPDSEGRSQVNCVWSEHGFLWREYEGLVFLYLPEEGTTVERPSDVKWFQVEFDNGATRFSIPIRWREAVS